MARLFICTQGTSIANKCQSLRSLQAGNVGWNEGKTDEMRQFEKELNAFIQELSVKKGDVEKAAAELTVLAKAKLTGQDRVVLLSTDTYLGNVCAHALKSLLEKHYAVKDVQIRRVEGLQVHNRERLEREGLSNFITMVRREIEATGGRDDEIFLCPNGGFKGVVPFLTILGMRYHCRVLYTFEHAECLITLPSLPFTLDTKLFRRAENALKKLTNDVEQHEEVYLNNIEDYDESERVLFLGFVEQLPNGMVSPSAMLEPLLDAASRQSVLMLSSDAIKVMKKLEGTPAYAILVKIMRNAQEEKWRNAKQHMHPLETTDLIAIKPGRTTERVLGYLYEGCFYVARVYSNHDDYDAETTGVAPQKKDYPLSKFKQWLPEEVDTPMQARLLDDLCTENRMLEEENERIQGQLVAERECCERVKKARLAEKESVVQLEKKLQQQVAAYDKLRNASLIELLRMWWKHRWTKEVIFND